MRISSTIAGLFIVGAMLSGCASAQAPVAGDRTNEPASKPTSTKTPEAPEPPEEKKEDLAVVDVAFGRDDSDPTMWWYVVVFENPNADYIFPSASIDVEAVGSDGVILDTSSDYLTILSGQSALTGSFYEVGDEEIAELEVRGPLAEAAVKSPADETGSFSTEGIESVRDDWSTTVSGVLSGTFSEEQESVEVVVVARDADGTIVNGGFTYVDRLPVDGKARFEVSFYETMPDGTTYEAFASL
jgi:hypothetical protein